MKTARRSNKPTPIENAAQANPTTQSNTPANTMNNNYNTFMQAHRIARGEDKVSTNTRIGGPGAGNDPSLFAGNFHIPDDEYRRFLQLYYDDIVSKKKTEYLTEAQVKNDGPILVDLDFRFPYSCDSRQYTKDHIDDLVNEYLDEFKKMYQFEESSQFSVFVLEKPNVNRVEAKQITKDGIHLIFGIKGERKAQILLRKRMLTRLTNLWAGGEIPITNAIDEVLDEGISMGTTNWQAYGSCKPNHEAYRLTYIYKITGYDTSDGEFRISVVDAQQTGISRELFMMLSARHTDHPSFFYTSSFINEVNSVADAPVNRRAMRQANNATTNLTSAALLAVRNHDELQAMAAAFLETITDAECEIRDVWEYTLVLPDSFYEQGSYTKWIRVGWALRNVDDRLFILWVVFSAKAARFDFTSIPDMYDMWLKFDMRNPNEITRGLTKRSIMHWAKENSREEYNRIREKSIDYAIDRSLGSYESIEDGKPDKRGCTDYDIATILHQLFKAEYVCSSIQNNRWYKFEGHRWVLIDSGVYLRKHISNELRMLYSKKATHYMDIRSRLDESEHAHRIKQITAHIDKIMSVYMRLGNSNDKKNIMTEAKELFYYREFEQELDANPYLICFKNGVVDFKNKVFRRGQPEDHLTKSTNIDYIEGVYENPKYKPIIDELRDFMGKLFPQEELCRYMWDHLASTLIGILPDQTWNIYIGEGQNGKSVLVKLMEYVLGEYKGTVPLSLLTDRRTKIGGTSPEVIGLQGLRYAVMQEPTKGERVNEGVMKQLVSGIDPIQARGLYMQNAVSFYPQFKLILCSNYLMEIKSNDHGTWRRIRVVPFQSLFTENPVENDPIKPYQFKIDRTIEERVREWKEVFASMLVLRVFETNGIVKDCDIVLSASNTYRQGQDAISQFITDNVIITEGGRISKTDLKIWFTNWIDQTYGNKSGPSLKDVVDEMNKRYKRCEKTKVWLGVSLLDQRTLTDEVDDDDIPEVVDI
jgi:P4 family phage/plasmid primase-like protien